MSDIKKRRDEDDIIDGEIVGEFTGETFLNLPTVDDDVPSVPAAPYDSARRDFLLRLVLGGTAALALGGSAALLYNQRRQEPRVQEVILPYGSEAGEGIPSDMTALAQRIADLEYELAATMAERDQALTDLNASQSELEVLRAQLAEATGINDLWQALDNVGLDALLASTLGVVQGALSAALDVLDLLDTGVTAVRSIIQKFLSALPGPSAGIRWLQERAAALSGDLSYLTQQVREVVESTQPFTSMIAEFVLWVLERLPFGAGDRARAGMEAMQSVVNSLPAMVTGINEDVLDPLADWFGDNVSRNLTGTVINPIQTRLVTPASDAVTKFREFATSFEETLVIPVQNALVERETIRQQIEAAQLEMGRTAT